MRPLKVRTVAEWIGGFCLLHGILAAPAAAYVDPGTAGVVSQILYVLFYAALAAFFYSFRRLKEYLTHAKQMLAKLFGKRS